MLITKNAEVKIISKNIERFSNLGYNVNYKDIIIIDINDLEANSHYKVKVKCDICEEEKIISYREHLSQRKKHNFDTCTKCKNIKSKKTNLERYGVEHILQRTESLEKFKN